MGAWVEDGETENMDFCSILNASESTFLHQIPSPSFL